MEDKLQSLLEKHEELIDRKTEITMTWHAQSEELC